MQPTDQISIAAVYSEQFRSNSGARYQRVTTYSVMKSVSDVVLASPKSPTFRSQFALRNKLLDNSWRKLAFKRSISTLKLNKTGVSNSYCCHPFLENK
uniref:Uncharacterized protein n=1 Tax=Solanum lycopersicum TaxID=4081 RepID=A0A3Q7F5J0_SOLLC